VKVFPAMLTVPVREVWAVLAAIESETLPLPEPVAPTLTVIHAALETAVHAQPEPELTLTVVLEAALPMEADVLPSP
jgi:hypothetical protein